MRDGQSFPTVVRHRKGHGGEADQEIANDQLEDTLEESAGDDRSLANSSAEKIGEDHWRYTFGDPLPQLEQEDAQTPSFRPLRNTFAVLWTVNTDRLRRVQDQGRGA